MMLALGVMMLAVMLVVLTGDVVLAGTTAGTTLATRLGPTRAGATVTGAFTTTASDTASGGRAGTQVLVTANVHTIGGAGPQTSHARCGSLLLAHRVDLRALDAPVHGLAPVAETQHHVQLAYDRLHLDQKMLLVHRRHNGDAHAQRLQTDAGRDPKRESARGGECVHAQSGKRGGTVHRMKESTARGNQTHTHTHTHTHQSGTQERGHGTKGGKQETNRRTTTDATREETHDSPSSLPLSYSARTCEMAINVMWSPQAPSSLISST
jgi:hypothetical protein